MEISSYIINGYLSTTFKFNFFSFPKNFFCYISNFPKALLCDLVKVFLKWTIGYFSSFELILSLL